MTKQPRKQRPLTDEERKLIAMCFEIASQKFQHDANVAPAESITVANIRQSVRIDLLAGILAVADSIVLMGKKS